MEGKINYKDTKEYLISMCGKYSIVLTHWTPYGLLTQLTEKKANQSDIYEILYCDYYRSSLLKNSNKFK
jgi:hypothetical protein